VPVPDVMRRYVDAVTRRDIEAAYACFDPNLHAHVPGRSSLAGEVRGRDAFINYIETARALSRGGDITLEVVDVLTSDERFALLLRETFHREEGDVQIHRANVYRVEGHRIVEVWIYEANQYDVDEVFVAVPGD
jgi:ketosteroid isomerase-like protein